MTLKNHSNGKITMRFGLFILLIIVTSFAWGADLVLKTPVKAQDVEKPMPIGTVTVPALGKVSFTAEKHGMQLLIHATGQDGSSLGRAESTVGLSSVPIHIVTPNGLEKIEIIWNVSTVTNAEKDRNK
jgi:hypothetical protein